MKEHTVLGERRKGERRCLPDPTLLVEPRRSWKERRISPAITQFAMQDAHELREENRRLRSAAESVLAEVSWFVSREKNLAKKSDSGLTWAKILDSDLDPLRAALARKP